MLPSACLLGRSRTPLTCFHLHRLAVLPYDVPGARARVETRHVRRAAEIETARACGTLVENSRRKYLVLWREPDLQQRETFSTPRN